MLLTPEYIFRAIEAITPEFLRQHGITALVLDVDNTLTGDGSQQLDATVQQWLDTMRAAGVRLTIVSNNTAARVRPFADRVGLAWVPLACKPLPVGLAVAAAALAFAKIRWPWWATSSTPTGWRRPSTASGPDGHSPRPRPRRAGGAQAQVGKAPLAGVL